MFNSNVLAFTVLIIAALLVGCTNSQQRPVAVEDTPTDTPLPSTNTPRPTSMATDRPSPSQTANPTRTFTPTSTFTVTPTEVKLTEEEFNQLTSENRQQVWDEAPGLIDGFSKSNFSTLKPYLIIYRDVEENAQFVLNLLDKKRYSLLDVGIAEFVMRNPFNPSVDGKKSEFTAFAPDIPDGADPAAIEKANIDSLERMIDYILGQDVKWGDYIGSTASTPVEYLETFHGWVANLTDNGAFTLVEDSTTQNSNENTLFLDFYTLSDQAMQTNAWIIVYYKSKQSQYHVTDLAVAVAMNEDDFMYYLAQIPRVTTPPYKPIHTPQ
jgi:hypothetical protein